MSSNIPGSPSENPVPDQPPALTPEERSRPLPKDRASTFTRAGALWTSLILGFLVLILLLIFVTQNLDPVKLSFLGWQWTLPLGVGMLVAAIGGGLITFAVGTARIVQLRRAAKKNLAAAIR
ncbi:LapA family protein [Mycobacterium vicinigordonae]|uniref:DUF1049 domain-containing protein n=1 Tax=Mycobacterium vicinigordonae TaxID=1719132 RepID=A0A7D6E822_9MYCO|nr:lipopolysaccharide assembly protein LapA domain-containing protein [Mycobacterium vicinigordonae]QLL07285.1 DUF1049 domain-containing protein [Mycobacterium vicinigordonae]